MINQQGIYKLYSLKHKLRVILSFVKYKEERLMRRLKKNSD